MYRELATTSAPSELLPNGFSKAQIASSISPRLQELILLPTEKCNFRCTYCYEDFEIGKMSGETQNGIERFIDRRLPGLDKLTFAWFGGEPLLASKIVLRLSKFAHRKASERGVKFEGGLTTNGYLLNYDLFSELVSYNQTFYQITFDGWDESHDALRKRADGEGTFKEIWSNLLEMRRTEQDIEVVVRLHVRRDNIENLTVFMREFALAFGSDPRFRIDYQNLRDMGGEGGKTVVMPLSINELIEVRNHLESIRFPNSREGTSPVTPSEPSVVGESAGSRRTSAEDADRPYICYAAKANSLLVRANGRIGKCTVAFDDDRNDIGFLRADGTLELDNAKLRPWLRGLTDLDQLTMACPVSNMAPLVKQLDKSFIPIHATL